MAKWLQLCVWLSNTSSGFGQSATRLLFGSMMARMGITTNVCCVRCVEEPNITRERNRKENLQWLEVI